MDLVSLPNTTSTLSLSFMDALTGGWIFCITVVLPENLYVIWLIILGAGQGVASEFFSLNHSICEVIYCLQSFLALVARVFPDIFKGAQFLTGFSIIGRPLFQCLICLDCYMAVVHPVSFLKYKPLRYRLICCLFIWIMILVSCASSILIVNDFQMFAFMVYCLSQALLTLAVKLFCLVAVLRALKHSGPGEGKREENHMKRRAVKNIVLIMMAMILIYISYMLSGFTYVLTHEVILGLWSFSQGCFLLGGSVQPLLYLYRNGKLQFWKDFKLC